MGLFSSLPSFSIKGLYKLFHRFRHRVVHSIAFYPVLISFLFILLSLMLLVLEQASFVEDLREKLSFMIVKDYDTARLILSTIFGSILSLTVFTFTMVMSVLNQASSNFSPRLLPGLVSNRRHQVILGIYVGTLLLSLFLLMVLGAYGAESNQLGFSVMITAFCGVVCVVLFVYFIHNISSSIQIHNIINYIYTKSDNLLTQTLDHQRNIGSYYKAVDTSNWQTIYSNETGYYRSFDYSLLKKELLQQKVALEILPYPDQHIWYGAPLLRIQTPVNEEARQNLLLCCYILSNQHEDDSAVGGMIKLTEIAVRALSPGVNDPGTALNAISKIGQLLEKTLQVHSLIQLPCKEGDIILLQRQITATELMRLVIEPIRQYGKGDSNVSQRLLAALLFAAGSERILPQYLPALKDEIQALRDDVEAFIENGRDRQRLLRLQSPHQLPESEF